MWLITSLIANEIKQQSREVLEKSIELKQIFKYTA